MDGKQLKNSILQWAIQGKLVPQNPKDEPAQKLLEKIALSRHSERSEESSKRSKKTSKNPTSRIYRENGVWYEQVGTATPKDISDEIPFEIPENWAWCRFGNLVFNRDSERIPLSVDERKGLKKIYDYYGASGVIDKVDNYLFDKPLLLIGEDGANLINRSTPIAFIARGQYWVNNHAHVIDCINEDLLQYVCTFINAISLVDYVTGTAQPKMNQEKMNSILVAVPPLAEQKRIITKLEQVLPLAEEYGAAQEQLDKLNKELPEALKKSILQEAIQGKLVPQNSKDEPASVLLAKIQKEKETLVKQGKLKKKDLESTPIDEEEIPFEIPDSWTWCRLGSICDYLHRGKSPVYSDKKILPVMAQKCNQWDKIYTEKCLFADPKTIEKYTTEQYLQVGDVIINSTGGGTVGRTGFVDEYVFSEYDKFVADSHVTVVRSNKNVNPKYVYYFLITPLIQRGIEERCSGSTNQIELGTETIKNYLFPLPPLAEQKRIVAKLEQLFKVL